MVVNGVVASVFSTMAKHLETLPFYVLDFLFQVFHIQHKYMGVFTQKTAPRRIQEICEVDPNH